MRSMWSRRMVKTAGTAPTWVQRYSLSARRKDSGANPGRMTTDPPACSMGLTAPAIAFLW